MTEEQDKLLREIHQAVVSRNDEIVTEKSYDPRYGELRIVAQAVVDARYSDINDWESLNLAIGELYDVLQRTASS